MTGHEGRTRPEDHHESHRRPQELQANPALTDPERLELVGLYFVVALAYHLQGTPEARQEVIRCCDTAIDHFKKLDLDEPEYRHNLMKHPLKIPGGQVGIPIRYPQREGGYRNHL